MLPAIHTHHALCLFLSVTLGHRSATVRCEPAPDGVAAEGERRVGEVMREEDGDRLAEEKWEGLEEALLI